MLPRVGGVVWVLLRLPRHAQVNRVEVTDIRSSIVVVPLKISVLVWT